MVTILETERLPILLWLDDLTGDALQQAKNLANLPDAFHHIAVMPDAHFGYGMPIGGVLATTDHVIPNGVGVDIGCGVAAVKTSVSSLSPETLKAIMQDIRKMIPLGFKHHKRKQPHDKMPDHSARTAVNLEIVEREYEKARTQVGTLGGGNHFIEIQRGSDGSIWYMIHSGSRNLGYQVADHYNKIATQLNKKKQRPLPSSWQLAGLELETQLAQQYLEEMEYCLAFADQNRLQMSACVHEAFANHIPEGFTAEEPITIAHNYAARETHFDTEVIVHRKGATRARTGEHGIIPGSQGSSSYIVRGKGNPESFCSCSHGAGRRLGRKQARKSLDLQQERKKLEEKGIIHSIRGKSDLDEAAGAYKNIELVIRQQQDLVEVEEQLEPLAVIKG